MKLEDTAKLLQPKFLENSSESLIIFQHNKLLSKTQPNLSQSNYKICQAN